jgi:hypothetical protein
MNNEIRELAAQRAMLEHGTNGRAGEEGRKYDARLLEVEEELNSLEKRRAAAEKLLSDTGARLHMLQATRAELCRLAGRAPGEILTTKTKED